MLRQRASHRDRVSAIAALTLSPVRRRVGLLFRTYPKGYVNSQAAADFLRELLRQIRGRLIVVWDRGTMHRGEPIRRLLGRTRRLTLEFLPPYAPDLNPVEFLWNHLKYHHLANFAPRDIPELDQRATEHLQAIQHDQTRLQRFFAASQLTWDETETTSALSI